MIVWSLKRAFSEPLAIYQVNPRLPSTMRVLAWQRAVPGVWETSCDDGRPTCRPLGRLRSSMLEIQARISASTI